MVRFLGRSGQLEKAVKLIEEIPYEYVLQKKKRKIPYEPNVI